MDNNPPDYRQNDHNAAAEHDEKKVKSTSDISSWDTKFLKVDHTTLVQMILAADFLNIKGLLDLTCKKIAKMIKGMTVEEVRRTFRIQNDFTADEEERVRKENAWIRFPEKYIPMDDSVMDDILLDSAHDVDNEGGQVIYCLNNSEFLHEIFLHLSNLELVEFSRLNQMWHYEALKVIRKRGNMTASLNFNGSCQVAQAFAADLQQMTIVPFQGMKIVLPNGLGPCQCAISAMDPTVGIISDPLPFQTLSLELGDYWGVASESQCRGFVLAKRILQDLSVVLEELSFRSSSNSARNIINDVIRECSFPRLKVLKLEATDYRTLIHPVYLRALISRSPNLQEVHVDKPTPDLVAVVHGTSVTLVCSGEISVLSVGIPENMMNGALRLQKIKLVYGNRRCVIDGFNRIVPRLLQAPCTSTLYELTVDSVFAAPLVCYGVSFETVRKLTLVIDYNELQQPELHHILRLVKDFNFTRVFPNLTKVHIEMLIVDTIKQLPASLDRFILEANAILREPMPERAANIKELHLHCHDLTSATAPLFAQMLPNIERLYVEGSEGQNLFNFESICEHFVNLKELHIKSNSLEDTANFDCDFCGISFDEVVQLMQKDDAYLQRVNIVPVKPSIACLTNLRVLNLEYDLERRPEPVIYDARNPMFFLSKITGLIVLARCPNLAVNLKIFPDGARAVSHLKPYVAVDLYN